MAYTPLATDYKDDILAPSNTRRKYQQIFNEDGTISLVDVTQYSQEGSSFGAKEVNEERSAINKINSDRIVTLDEIDLVTEPGFFVDAMAVRELNSKSEMYVITREDIEINGAWQVLEFSCEKVGDMVFLNVEIYTSSYQVNHKYENVFVIHNPDLIPISNTPLNTTGYDGGFGNGVACGCVIKNDGTMYLTIPQTGRNYVVINAAYRVA